MMVQPSCSHGGEVGGGSAVRLPAGSRGWARNGPSALKEGGGGKVMQPANAVATHPAKRQPRPVGQGMRLAPVHGGVRAPLVKGTPHLFPPQSKPGSLGVPPPRVGWGSFPWR